MARNTDRRASTVQKPPPGAAGVPVDASGGPTIDPTKNVLDLVEAAVRRLDDMTGLRGKLVDEQIKRLEREQALILNMADLRAAHQKDLDALESKRLDAMRQVDQLAVKTEADRSALAISALAAAAATTAETLRSAVNTSATNLATQLTNTVNAITERIASLEKSSYTGLGKQQVIDPQLTELISEMRAQAAHSALSSGKVQGVGLSANVLVGVVGLFGTVLMIGGILVTLVLFLNNRQQTPPIYTPAPQGTVLPSNPPQTVPR